MTTKELSEQEITRFGAHFDHNNWCVHMIQKSNGDWMKYSSHESTVAVLRAEIERLKKQLEPAQIDERSECEKWLSIEFEFDEAFDDSGREGDIARRAWQARAQLERGEE